MYKPIDTLQCIKDMLLKQVVFCLEEKTVRKGKLLLFNSDDYYVRFIIQTNKNVNKTYEIPYPYRVLDERTQVIFSYQLLDLCKDNHNKYQRLLLHTPATNTNKLHDKRLTITIIDTQ